MNDMRTRRNFLILGGVGLGLMPTLLSPGSLLAQEDQEDMMPQ